LAQGGSKRRVAMTRLLVEHAGEACAVCLAPLGASTVSLPACGHAFHAVCLASALKDFSHCPLCRLTVDPHVRDDVAVALLAHLFRDFGVPRRGWSSSNTVAATVDTLGRIARRGDASQIVGIAHLVRLWADAGATADFGVDAVVPQGVVLAAVRAIRALVPNARATGHDLQDVQSVLKDACSFDPAGKKGFDDDVRCASLHILRDIGRRGDEATLSAVRWIFKDSVAGHELRLFAADTFQAVAALGDPLSIQAGLVALQNSDDSVRSVGLTTLRQICGARGRCEHSVLEELGRLVACHERSHTRSIAVELIGQLDFKSGAYGIALASMGLEDKDKTVRHAALCALRHLWEVGDPDAIATLNSVVDPSQDGCWDLDDARLRCLALDTLTQVARPGDIAAVRVAASALDVKEHTVRVAAMQALKRLSVKGDEQAIQTLLPYVWHDDVDVKRLSIEVLGCVATESDQQAVELLRSLQACGNMGLQDVAEQALKRVSENFIAVSM